MPLSKIGRTVAALLAAALLVAAGSADIRAASLPFTPAADQGVFLHVSDIHFDPFADPALVPRLIAAPVEDWAGILASAPPRFPQYGQDSTYTLLMSMLEAAKGVPYDYILNTGDNLSHDFKTAFLAAGGDTKDYESFAVKTMLFVNRMLQESFPGVPLIYALGNNDSSCGDYMLAPDGAMLTQVGGDLPVVAGSPQALHDFATGGFYVVPHPTVANHDIVVLSDVFWSGSYRDKCQPHGGDPGSAELAWLEWTLYQAKVAGRSVSLVMHIPPGIDGYSSARHACPDTGKSFWTSAYAERFLALADAYKHILRGSYAGHTHMDDFRVLSDRDGTPFLTTQIAPAVSPVFNNNPAFIVLLYSRSDATVRDYATFYLANLGQAGAAGPDWKLEYTFDQAYGLDRYNPPQVFSLAKRIRSDAAVRKSFVQHYAAETPERAPITDDNWSAFTCAQTAMTLAAYAACRCPETDAGKGTPR